MAKDILSLGVEGEEEIEVPVVPVDVVRPRPVPDLDVLLQTALTTADSPMAPDLSPMAPDLFPSRVHSKKRNWRLRIWRKRIWRFAR